MNAGTSLPIITQGGQILELPLEEVCFIYNYILPSTNFYVFKASRFCFIIPLGFRTVILGDITQHQIHLRFLGSITIKAAFYHKPRLLFFQVERGNLRFLGMTSFWSIPS